MSFDAVKANLKKEGESLLYQLRIELSEDLDVFRSNSSESYIEEIIQMKRDLKIAEAIALYEQLERERKPIGNTSLWYDKYKKYLNLKRVNSFHSCDFVDKEDIKDFKDELEKVEIDIVETTPCRSVRPDLKSIVRILEFVCINMEFDEDLNFDVKTFLKRYEMYQYMTITKDGKFI